MTRITKNELAAQLHAQGLELEAMRKALGDAQHDLQRVRAQRDELAIKLAEAVSERNDLRDEIDALKAPAAIATDSVAKDQAAVRRAEWLAQREARRAEGPSAFAQRCAAARELAMRSGKVIRLADR